MTRILQIRRGTSAQNDNFTGLDGEITFDTTNKTLRVHDGSTLGGIKLARKDEIENDGTNFDINTVPATFWTNLFATYQSSAINKIETALYPIVNTTCFDVTLAYDNIPMFAMAVLVCQTPQAGYSIDDEVRAFGIGDYCSPMINYYVSNGELHLRLFEGEQAFWVCHKTDGSKVNITNANWKIKFIVYY